MFFIHLFQKKQFIRLIRAKSSKERSMKIYQIGRGVLLERCGWKKHKSTIITCLCHHVLFFCHYFCAYFLTNSNFIKHASHITIWLWLFLLLRAPCYFHIAIGEFDSVWPNKNFCSLAYKDLLILSNSYHVVFAE